MTKARTNIAASVRQRLLRLWKERGDDFQTLLIRYATPGRRVHVRVLRWRPQGDSNPCTRDENPVSWAGLDDGDRCI